MSLPCYPIIEPTGHALHALRHAVHHQVHAAHAPATHAGIGVNTPLRHGVHHLHGHHAAHPVAGASHSAPAAAGCAPVPGPLPAGPGAPLLRHVIRAGGGSGHLGGVAAGPLAGIGSAGGMVGLLSSSSGALVAGALLAGILGFGAGGGATYLDQVGAFSPLGSGATAGSASLAAPIRSGAGSETGAVMPGAAQSLVATVGDQTGALNQVAPAAGAVPVPESVVATQPASAAPATAPAMTAVPEPASLLTLMVGGLGTILARRRARRRA